jgi:hypothetical protein
VAYAAFTEKAMAQCTNCGRRFFEDRCVRGPFVVAASLLKPCLPPRLVVHMRSCKPGSGSKPVAGKGFPGAASMAGTGGSGMGVRVTQLPFLFTRWPCLMSGLPRLASRRARRRKISSEPGCVLLASFGSS